MYEYNATVLSVHDGDTCTLNVDCGFGIWIKQTVRLKGINTPELRASDPKPGEAARDQLKLMLPLGSGVRIITYKDATEKYGRLLAEIRVVDRNVVATESVNMALVRMGFAKLYDGKGEKPV